MMRSLGVKGPESGKNVTMSFSSSAIKRSAADFTVSADPFLD